MTAEEQLKYLAGEFGADSVNYFVGTDPIFAGKLEIPAEIKNAGYGRYQQFVGNKQASAPAPAAPSRAQFGIPKAAAAAVKQNPVEDTLNTGYVAAPTPKSSFGMPKAAAKPAGLSGLRPNSTIDQDKLKAALSGIRSATGQNNQASMAANLLNDTDLADYQDGIPENEGDL